MKIIAMVMMNGRWAYVFDKRPVFIHREQVIDGKRFMVGVCGPFRTFLQYQKSGPNFKAFAGREMTVRLASGEDRKLKDDWWDCADPESKTVRISYNSIDQLKECYVFYGGHVDAEALQKYVDEYESRIDSDSIWKHADGGYRYRYREFDNLINMPKRLSHELNENLKLKRDKQALIKEVKRLSALVKEPSHA